MASVQILKVLLWVVLPYLIKILRTVPIFRSGSAYTCMGGGVMATHMFWSLTTWDWRGRYEV